MKVTIHPSQLKGVIQAPASKSSMQRACAAALLSKGKSIIQNPGHSNDDKAAMGIIKAMGADIEINNEQLIINNSGFPFTTNDLPAAPSLKLQRSEAGRQGSPLTIDCGESGLSIRMFTPIVALSDKAITINGSGSLATRPMDFFDEILPKLGVKIKSNNGKLPMIVQGPLIPANIEVDGSLSSQFLTGLLMAFSFSTSPQTPLRGRGASEDSDDLETVSIKVKNLNSKPYIDLTLDVMKQFGLRIPENRNYEEFIFHNDFSKIPPSGGVGASYTVEGDWSGGAFLLVAGAIAGPVIVRGLDINSTQADKAVIDAMKKAHISMTITEKEISINPGGLKGYEFNATDCPDLFPPLVALAAYCTGETKIKGVSRLTHKESNRALTLQQEFGKMGVKIELRNDTMIIHGGAKLTGAKVHSCHDHRIAMALAVAALKADGETEIEEAQAVNKSYPDFYSDLQKMNVVIAG